jgi:membrane protein implicated in regulation of membrane protease activity
VGETWGGRILADMILALAIVLAVVVLPSPLGLIAVGTAAVIEIGEIVAWRKWLSRYSVKTGAEALVGMTATVLDQNRVRVRGEIWNARSEDPLEPGTTARIAAVDGLVLSLVPVRDA